jgi:hypothetical protein
MAASLGHFKPKASKREREKKGERTTAEQKSGGDFSTATPDLTKRKGQQQELVVVILSSIFACQVLLI